VSILSIWIDESVNEKVQPCGAMVVGGVLIDLDKVPNVVRGWHGLKKRLNLPPSIEIKWNPSKGLKKKYEECKVSYKELRVKSIEFIAGCEDLQCIVAVMREERTGVKNEKDMKPDRKNYPLSDFYCEGLKYVLQRAAEEVCETNAESCFVVCDTPNLGKKEKFEGCLRRGQKALEKTYSEWYWTGGVDVGPGREKYVGPLKDISFHPSVLIADATYNDMLQIADIVVGAISEWVEDISQNKWEEQWKGLILNLCKRIRSKHGTAGTFFGDGLIIHPPEWDLWKRLKESIGLDTDSAIVWME
jgi:hypothetical protein